MASAEVAPPPTASTTWRAEAGIAARVREPSPGKLLKTGAAGEEAATPENEPELTAAPGACPDDSADPVTEVTVKDSSEPLPAFEECTEAQAAGIALTATRGTAISTDRIKPLRDMR